MRRKLMSKYVLSSRFRSVYLIFVENSLDNYRNMF